MQRCISRTRDTNRSTQSTPQPPYQAQGPPVQHQQSSNPFFAPLTAAPLPPTQPNFQRKSKKKKREPSTPAAPVVPQPKGVMVPAPAVPLAPSQTPPGQKWALVLEDILEPEPAKPNEELKAYTVSHAPPRTGCWESASS